MKKNKTLIKATLQLTYYKGNDITHTYITQTDRLVIENDCFSAIENISKSQSDANNFLYVTPVYKISKSVKGDAKWQK